MNFNNKINNSNPNKMKSLKLSITFIGIFITSICFAQNNPLPNDATKDAYIEYENPVQIGSSDSKPEINQEIPKADPVSHKILSDEEEEKRASKEEAEAERLSKLIPASELNKLYADYEATNNYPHEDEIQIHIDNNFITTEWLNENGIDKNSKLYKRVTSQKK
jgi:hypothetical protein